MDTKSRMSVKFDFEKSNALLRAVAFETVLSDARELYAVDGDALAAAQLACEYYAVRIRPTIERVLELQPKEDCPEWLEGFLEFDPAEIAAALLSPPIGEA
jgi:hypothetical protein